MANTHVIDGIAPSPGAFIRKRLLSRANFAVRVGGKCCTVTRDSFHETIPCSVVRSQRCSSSIPG